MRSSIKLLLKRCKAHHNVLCADMPCTDAPSAKGSSQQGFTLIEIMIVVVILGVLATLVIPRVIDRPDQARAIKAKQDIRNLESTLNLYKLDNYTYPTTSEGLAALVTPPSNTNGSVNWSGPYVDRLPKDPWGNEYFYAMPGNNGAFDLYTLGSDRAEGGEGSAADIGNWDLR